MVMTRRDEKATEGGTRRLHRAGDTGMKDDDDEVCSG